MAEYKIIQPDRYNLKIQKNKSGTIFKMLIYSSFIFSWYLNLGIDVVTPINLVRNPGIWIFILAPLLIFKDLFKDIKLLTNGYNLIFDGDSKAIIKNNKQIAKFSDVYRIQMRTIEDTDTRDVYRLSLVLKDRMKILLIQTADNSQIFGIAESISDLLDVCIFRKA